MKKEENKTRKLKVRRNLKEKGITLVALVVTIIILLILAGVTLNLALGEGGIFARAKNTTDRYQAAQANELDQMTQLEEMLNSYGQGGTSTGGGEGSTNTVEPPPPTPPTEGSSAGDLSEKLEGDDSVIGKIVTGLTGGVAESYTWEILYADESNIYLISTDYIEVADCPQKDSATITKGSFARTAWLGDTLLGKYEGTANINETGKKLNKDYFSESKNYSSIEGNMKAVAYMLDTGIWTNKIVGADNSKVEYVVGGPSVELLFKAYNAKKKTDYRAQASSATGYQISKDGGSSWAKSYNNMLDTSESTFVITSKTNAFAYWLSSPSTHATGCVLLVDYDGSVAFDGYNETIFGFRPIVCLAEGVTLEPDGEGYKIK